MRTARPPCRTVRAPHVHGRIPAFSSRNSWFHTLKAGKIPLIFVVTGQSPLFGYQQIERKLAREPARDKGNGLFNAIVSLYYYLKVVKAMYINKIETPVASFRSDGYTRVSLAICTAGIIVPGIAGVVYDTIDKFAFGMQRRIWTSA